MDRTKTIILAVVIIAIVAVGAYAFISANSNNTKIVVVSNDTLKNGDWIQIQLIDEYRNPYPNEVIDVKILDDSGWANKYQVTTDDKGEATVELLALQNGNYTVHCNYNGTMFNKQARSVTPLVIDDGLG